MKRELNILCALSVALMAAAAHAAADDGAAIGALGLSALSARHAELQPQLTGNVYDAPIYIESENTDNTMRADIFGVLQFDFETVKAAMQQPRHWAELAALHPNVKAASYDLSARENPRVTFYVGRKFYQPPEDTKSITYRFTRQADTKDYFNVILYSRQGPQGTENHRVCLEGVPAGDNRSFIHLSYACEYGFTARSAMTAYLATLGRSKVGFTVVEKNDQNEVVYIQGVRGIVERNAMRYFLSVRVFLQSLSQPVDQRFEYRLGQWYQQSMKYRQQLYEYPREKYFTYKHKEREERLKLQEHVNSAGQ